MASDRTLAVLSHLLGLFFGFLAPLVVLLASKDDYTKKNAKLALNCSSVCSFTA